MSTSRWRAAARVAALVVAGLGLPLGARPAAAQEGLAGFCTPRLGTAPEECHLAAAAVTSLHPRIGTALWGGSPVPGTASTLGMRLGSFPRISGSGRLTFVPTTVPSVDAAGGGDETAWLTGVSAQGTVGLLTGFSPYPTVGGVMSVDAFARLSFSTLPTDEGFQDGAVWAWLLGVRVGALRESFTLPGVSISGSYARSTEVAFGDPDDPTTLGYWSAPVTDLNATLAITKRIAALGLTGGVAWDRYGGSPQVGYRQLGTAARVVQDVDASIDRWSGFVNASWTMLVFHGVAELGWQESPEPVGLSSDRRFDPTGWWVGLAFRISI